MPCFKWKHHTPQSGDAGRSGIKCDRMNWESIVEAIQRHRLGVRVKWTGDSDEPEWAAWAIIPTNGYIEVSTIGPIAYRDIEWIEVDASMIAENGRLGPRADVDEALAQIKIDFQQFVFNGTRAHIAVNLHT